jgi:hypothetical protein
MFFFIVFVGSGEKCMIWNAEEGRGTWEKLEEGRRTSKKLTTDENLSQLSKRTDKLEINFIVRGLTAESNLCGNDWQFVTEMSEECRHFYFAHISVSEEKVQAVYLNSIGQDNFNWRKERQVSYNIYIVI